MAAQRLRYRVFIEELGGAGEMVDHAARLEKDRFDPYFDHLILIDNALDAPPIDKVVGVYRLLRAEQAAQIGQFYSQDEYDLRVLKQSGRRLLELGRSCLLPHYRGGAAMFHLWSGLAAYVFEHEIEVLFGVASFHGTDVDALAAPLSLCITAILRRKTCGCAHRRRISAMDLYPRGSNRPAQAMLEVPALIKAYLRLGGFVGEGAYVDHAFNTVDVCLVMDTKRMNDKQKAIYTKGLQA